MKLTKRQRILAGIAGVAAAGWGLDRWVIPQPASTQAARSTSDVSALPGATLDPSEDFSLPPPATPVSEVQRSAADVFDVQRLALRVELPSEAGTSTVRLSAPSFAAQYALRATILGPEPVALVGQRKMHIGDTLGGYVLREILADAAVFQSENGDRAILQVSRLRK